MTLPLKTRKRLALIVLLVWMPLYIVAAVSLVNWAGTRWGRLPFWGELVVYIGLGFLWVLPFKRIFSGVGRGDEE